MYFALRVNVLCPERALADFLFLEQSCHGRWCWACDSQTRVVVALKRCQIQGVGFEVYYAVPMPQIRNSRTRNPKIPVEP